jgi:hypothetical protein
MSSSSSDEKFLIASGVAALGAVFGAVITTCLYGDPTSGAKLGAKAGTMLAGGGAGGAAGASDTSADLGSSFFG